ncbi:MAG TPA: hypothetical protein DDY88_07715 [Actinobacteria bacterium]|nr:hypothetical protein [Actinomycetota bacterium]
MSKEAGNGVLGKLTGSALKFIYRLHISGQDSVPSAGPVIFHIEGDELLSGPALKAVSPRPVQLIVSGALNEVFLGGSQILAGDIALDGFGFGAAEQAIAVLNAGGTVAFVGEQPPLGYLVAASGATIVPVRITGAGGRVRTDPPRPGSRISIVFEAPIQIAVQGDPCALATVQEVAEQVRQARADAQA